MIELERSLTKSIEKVEPWLTTTASNNSSIVNIIGNNKSRAGIGARVRPIPTSMDEAQRVLAVARNFSGRTSAPAGWNPNAPVIGFSTPNPLPHQLRRGALAALELQRARQAERDKKRKRQEELQEEQNKEKEKQKTEEEESNKNKTEIDAGGEGGGDKKRATAESNNKQQQQQQQQGARPPQPVRARATSLERRVARPVIATTMNLSDSSSEEDSDDDDDSD